ncbi:MAG: sulfatase-like hydrolase/transferase [Deltaproteobacteria bacterium]|nr:sulfatase-like hydrolase/transferase [Deltaproteobacteria bacterium]
MTIKINIPMIIIKSVLCIFVLYSLFTNCSYAGENTKWEFLKIKAVPEKKRMIRNEIKETFFLNENYRNFQNLSLERPVQIEKIKIKLNAHSVLKGRIQKQEKYLHIRGNEIIIGIFGIEELINKFSLNSIEAKILADENIQIETFLIRFKNNPLPKSKIMEGILNGENRNFTFYSTVKKDVKFSRVTMDFYKRKHFKKIDFDAILFKIKSTMNKRLNCKIGDIYLINKNKAIIGKYPASGYYSHKKLNLKSVFIPSNCTISYVIVSKKTMLFDGYLGSSLKGKINFNIRINRKLLLRKEIAEGLQYFNFEVQPHNGKFELEIQTQGENKSIGVLGNIMFYEKGIEKKNVMLYLIDALRADFGGINNDITKNYFQKGAIFKNAYSNATWTADSIPVIFSGKYKTMLVNQKREKPFLTEDEVLLAEYFKMKGYTNVALITNPWLVQSNSSQGFDYIYSCWGKKDRKKFSYIPSEKEYIDFKYGQMEEYLNQIVRHCRNKKLFLYFHTIEPHIPYESPARNRIHSRAIKDDVLKSVSGEFWKNLIPPSTEHIQTLKALYKDAVILSTKYFINVINKLKTNKIFNKKSLLILTSDHGERFYEHSSWKHGTNDMYNEVIKIPMMIRGPKINPGIYTKNAQLADIYPTIIDWFGDKKQAVMVGDSLLQHFNYKEKKSSGRVIYSDGSGGQFLYSCIFGHIKVLVGKKNNFEIYDLKSDPGEKKDLSKSAEFKQFIEMAKDFRKSFKIDWINRVKSRISIEEIQRLKSLGYLN